MSDHLRIDPGLATTALTSARFNLLSRLGSDLSTIGTWDPTLSRRTRILVPVDVQAYVVDSSAPEAVVAVAGHPDDDDPFSPGKPLDAGVHLHWAMPDALSKARHDETTGAVAAPRLPDQWVVVRTLQPIGRRQVLTTGWVVDARTATVTSLASFTGPEPLDATAPPPPLTVTTHGLLWTASYAGSAGRFTFRDPLADLHELRKSSAPNGFAGDQAVYTVAGWWRAVADDPLHGARGPAELEGVLASLRWRLDKDAVDESGDEHDRRMAMTQKSLGLEQPEEDPAPQVYGSRGGKAGGAMHGVVVGAKYPVPAPDDVWIGEQPPTYDTLLHGCVLGVPVIGEVPAADDRPPAEELTIAVGTDTDDVVAAFGADGLGLGSEARGLAEDLMAAFSMGSVARLGTTDGLDEVAQREHENGFWSLPGAPLPGAGPDRLRTDDPTAAERPAKEAEETGKGTARERAEKKAREKISTLRWQSKFDLEEKGEDTPSASAGSRTEEAGESPGRPRGKPRSVTRPAPRYYRPQPLIVAVRGARPSPRHHGDGRFDPDGKLLVRLPGAAVRELAGWVFGVDVLPTLGSGAVPDEVLTVVREAVLLNPYAIGWLAEAGGEDDETPEPAHNRVAAELVRLHGDDGRYTGVTRLTRVDGSVGEEVPDAWAEVDLQDGPAMLQVSLQLAQLSGMDGTPPSPVALTTWRQPRAPLWLEWEVSLKGGSSLRGWRLEGYDLGPDAAAPPTDDVQLTLTGRGAVGRGVGEALRAGVRNWLESEQRRAVTSNTDPYASAPVLAQLAALDRPLDLVSASLDGLREQLLGIGFLGVVARDEEGKPTASGPPVPLFGGVARVDRLRLVDAFGRTLEVPEDALKGLATTLELEVSDGAGAGRSVRLRPRFQNSARWLLRLVDAAQAPGTPVHNLREAYVDQVTPAAAANPVAGFLLPDHIDESLEVFTAKGVAVGELSHDAIAAVAPDGEGLVSAVRWDPAPGRPVRADAGPLVGVAAQDRLAAEIAGGLVRADARARALPVEQRPRDSALVNLLRVIDTTLWTVDTFAGLGAGSLAGLVGRPIAVVRATLKLDLADDLAEVTVTAPGGPGERKAAFERLSDELVEVRLGTVTRTDDTLLGYFVDDDYEHLHVVDKGLVEHARHTGRTIGQLGLLGQATAPGERRLDHPYLVTEGVLRVRPGVTTVLTLLMLPMGKVHVTSGVLPRKAIGLAESWFAQGLKRVTPSVRVGPLLVDPAEIRLPLVSILGDKQTFSRRTGELAWRNDPILAATQTAYLPVTPHEVEEGWIRVTPDEDDG